MADDGKFHDGKLAEDGKTKGIAQRSFSKLLPISWQKMFLR